MRAEGSCVLAAKRQIVEACESIAQKAGSIAAVVGEYGMGCIIRIDVAPRRPAAEVNLDLTTLGIPVPQTSLEGLMRELGITEEKGENEE